MIVCMYNDYVNAKVIDENEISQSKEQGLHYSQVTDKVYGPPVL